MSRSIPIDLDDQIIEMERPPRRRWWRLLVILAALALILLFFRSLAIYVRVLWFESLGYASVYWYTFRLRILLLAIFAVSTIVILRGAFWLLERAFSASALGQRVVLLNNQPVSIDPARFLRPLAWGVSLLFGIFYGFGVTQNWRLFALYFNQTATDVADPIFGKPLGFYLFTLPLYQTISGWLLTLSFVILAAVVLYTLLSAPPRIRTQARDASRGRTGFAPVSYAFAAFLLLLAWRIYLSRFPYLWQDHQTFSGVTYTEANYLIPGLTVVAVTLVMAAIISLVNAFTGGRLRLLLVALALPIITYIIACILIPAYVTSFIVKPNELGRETPYIEHNIAFTRRAYGLDRIELRDFEADASLAALNLEENRATFDNIRLWDWRALQETLRQVQGIRTYYEFEDVDVDRYLVGGQVRQMMIAARELDTTKLPEQSRNWVNERLIYTHGYGVTMNQANGFTPEGRPLFTLSNMPVESSAPEIRVTRPQIYFGQKTNSDVYVRTKQKEFDYPQGETNSYTTYEGTGGILMGGALRRLVLAWTLGDLSKLPFTEDITAESRVLMIRNIRERVQVLAPFLSYDDDPYIVIGDDGRLHWMIDAFTTSATYPYSRHTAAGRDSINYIRNSVKVTIDAYDGTVNFYVFDDQDPLISSYRAAFPALFRSAGEMPVDLRAHVRYPETLIRTQGEVYGLYHTQNPKVFFQREDVWSVARQVTLGENNRQQSAPLDPYFVLMQLPGEQTTNEFVGILPFTPANRNNMIGWLAARSDGDAYGSLLVYNFPKSRLIDGPLQIEARIDQNPQLSSQMTLWNQQGSRVRRGNLLVIPVGRSLLYAEPLYLQSERSPMPELRIVVLATQERLAYGASFEEAMTSLFGDAARAAPQAGDAPEAAQAGRVDEGGVNGSVQPALTPGAPPQTTQQLINRAAEDLSEYRRLTAEGKFGEAGQKLESATRALEELRKSKQ